MASETKEDIDIRSRVFSNPPYDMNLSSFRDRDNHCQKEGQEKSRGGGL